MSVLLNWAKNFLIIALFLLCHTVLFSGIVVTGLVLKDVELFKAGKDQAMYTTGLNYYYQVSKKVIIEIHIFFMKSAPHKKPLRL